jgi:hypothetical protein
LVCLSANGALAQRATDWLLLGDKAMEHGDLYGALRYYGKAMELDSSRALHNYKYAEALRLNHNYLKAARYYYKVYRRDMDKQYPECGARLAEMQKQSAQYADAKATWRRVRDRYSEDPDSYWYRKAINEMRACDLAALWIQQPAAHVALRPFPEGINSDASEMAAVLGPDSTLTFITLRGSFDSEGRLQGPPGSYIPRLHMAQPPWMQSQPIAWDGLPCEVLGYTGVYGNGWQAAAARSDDGSYALWIHKGDRWQTLWPPAPDGAWYGHPAWATLGGRTLLFFSSNRTGSVGGRDIWYIDLDNAVPFPVHAGDRMNTPGDEVTPWYRHDQERLYFASDWHQGLGGFDLFYSDARHDRSFSHPENLKAPFNSPANDLYYSFNELISTGTLTSNRAAVGQTSSELCCNDLYHFAEAAPPPTAADSIRTLADLNRYLPVTLYFHNDEPDPRTTATTTRHNYLDTYRAYVAMLPDYETGYARGLGADRKVEAEEAMARFFLNEVDEGVRNLELFTTLLFTELEEGARIELTVKGFASPLAASDYNVKLTSRRIASLRNYLLQWEKGALYPYLEGTAPNGGILRLNEVPYGEYTAPAFVSDNPNDAGNSIFSIGAARERKIELTSVQLYLGDSTLADVRFESTVFNLGNVKAGSSVPYFFAFVVAGSTPWMPEIKTEPSPLLRPDALETKYLEGRHTWGGIVQAPVTAGKATFMLHLSGNMQGGFRELTLTMDVIP